MPSKNSKLLISVLAFLILLEKSHVCNVSTLKKKFFLKIFKNNIQHQSNIYHLVISPLQIVMRPTVISHPSRPCNTSNSARTACVTWRTLCRVIRYEMKANLDNFYYHQRDTMKKFYGQKEKTYLCYVQ